MAELTRRSLLRRAGSGAALAVLAHPGLERAMAAVGPARDIAFPDGVASGEPGTHAITLWTRVAGADRPARIGLQVAADPGFARTIVSTQAYVDPDAGGTARVTLRGPRLKPGERYWYRFESGGVSSPVGRCKTARPVDSREPARVAFFSCQEYIAGYYRAHADLALIDDLDVVVCLGDYVYEQAFAQIASSSGAVRVDLTAPDGETQTLQEYRSKYALYHSDASLRAMRARHPLVTIWDDHEVEDNYAGDLPGGQGKHRRVGFLERRANGYRAHLEAMPRTLHSGPPRIYGSLPIGNAELFLLDTRQYRSDQPCNPTDGAFVLGCPPASYDDPAGTLLGATQKARLKRSLSASRAQWKLIANQVMIMSLDLGNGNPLNTDSWDGYGAERAELCDHIGHGGPGGGPIEDVVFLTGDIHTFFAGEVTRTGRALDGPAGAAGAPVATELVGGAITSPGIVDRIASSERDRLAAGFVLDALIWFLNPHLHYVNQAYKGYGVLVAGPEGLDAQFRAVHDVRSPSSSTFELARLHVPAGEPRLELVRSFQPPPEISAREAAGGVPGALVPADLSLGAGDLSPFQRRAARRALAER